MATNTESLEELGKRLMATVKTPVESPRVVRPATPPPAKPAPVVHPAKPSVQKKRLFAIVTQTSSGLGWAKKLMEEGEQVVLVKSADPKEEDPDKFAQVGKDWMPTMDLSKAMTTLKGAYWIFDDNHLSAEADKLRKQGEKVFGTSALSHQMELDRAYAVQIAEQAGLKTPPTTEFKTTQEALAFLDTKREVAYVFKPNDGEFNYLTFVPSREQDIDANRELYFYLENLTKGAEKGFILQERKNGVEVNVEVWLHEGTPYFAMVGLESKRKHDRDLGEMSGCSQDLVFAVPLDSPIIKATVGKLLPFYKEKKYTGFADVNVIIGDGEVWFLEVCNRFGYSAHPNLFLSLALKGFGQIMADIIDGKVSGMYENFRKGFGASITVFLDHPRNGLPLHVSHRWEGNFYPYDGYKKGDVILLTGYSNEVGLYTESDYTPEAAAQATLDRLLYNEAVSYPDVYFRTDLTKDNYPNAPIRRYRALEAMGLV